MAKSLEIYKCLVCGNIIELLHPGDGELVCCDQPMTRFTANTSDAAKEKHVPVIETRGEGVIVKVGSVAHPMEADHYIEWIEFIQGDRLCRQALRPGQKPEAAFCATGRLTVREYCNKHGLWQAEKQA